MRLTVDVSRCTITGQNQTREGGVDRLTTYCTIHRMPGETWLPAQVRSLMFVGDLTPLFGFNGPWEVRSIEEEAGRNGVRMLAFRIRALLPAGNVTARTQLEEDGLGGMPNPRNVSLDRIAVDELLQEMQDHYPRPFGTTLAASQDGVGHDLDLSVDVQADTVRFTVAGREVTTTVTALLSALLDPDTPRSVSLPAAPRPRGRRRRRAMAGR
jgi:hypothetical protein